MTTPPQGSPGNDSATRVREELLYDGEFSRVLRVIHVDGRSVIRKESVGAAALQRLRHERNILRRLAGVHGVPKLIETEPRADWILMEDQHGAPIKDMLTFGAMESSELVRITLSVTRTVGAVHRRGVLHRDINPNNILMTVRDREPVLIDYHLSSLLSDDRLGTTRNTQIVGTLAYVAPEQTGRTGRRVDQRSDLYALGATMYEFATGRPPFGRGDALRLVHDHLAQVPTPPAEIDRRLPRALSDIILRLLEKEPDARYQSAEGLAHDLIAVRDELAAGRSVPLSLGSRDFPLRLPPPSTMVGRTSEIETLTAQFADARRGRARAVLIAGDSGVGKGALVEQLRPVVTANRGWMITGGYDQYRQDSRSDGGFQALRALGRLLLTEPEEQLVEWRGTIRDALGANADLMASVVPEIGVLLNISPPVPDITDPVQAERRGHQAVLDLLRAVVSSGRPLLLALDDLQWAGPTALKVIDDLMTDLRLDGLLIVGTYRDDSLQHDDTLSEMLARWRSLHPPPKMMHLDDLPPEDQVTFLQSMLRLPREEATELAQVVGTRSHGNPYDTVELINALRHDGALVQHDGGWSWDSQNVWRHLGRGDVTQLLAERLSTLPPESVALLETMACLGATMEIALLADASGEPLSRVEELLIAPAAEGLVGLQQGPDPTTWFQHDRVHEAVSARLSRSRRKEINRTVARRLVPSGQFASVAAEQYLAAIDTIDDPGELRELVQLFQQAARDVRTLNPATAERFLSTAIGLLRTVWRAGDEHLLLALRTQQHGVLDLLGRYEDMDRVFDAIRDDEPDPLELVDAVNVQVASLCDRGREADGVELGLDLLRRLGLDAPGTPVGAPAAEDWAALYTWASHLDLAEDLGRPGSEDPRANAIARVMEGLTAAAFFTDSAVVVWLVFESQRRWLSDGPSGPLAATLALAPAVTAGLREDYHIGYVIARHVLAICEARGFESATWFVRACLPLFASHWFEPLENSVDEGRRARDGLLKTGQLQSACYSYAATLGALLDTAPTLDALDAEVEPAIAMARSTGNTHALAGFIGYRQLLRSMRGQTNEPGGFSDETFDEVKHLSDAAAHPVDASMYRINRALTAAIFGDMSTLAEHAGATMPLIAELGGYREALAYLFQAFSLAQQMRASAPRTRTLSELDKCRDWLAQRAVDAPVNLAHLVHFIDAEREWALGEPVRAARAFDAALFGSGNRSRPWQRALIAERAAMFYFDRGLEYLGHTLISEAWRRYEAWGANAKAAQLERKHPFLRGSSTTQRELGLQPTGTSRLTPDALDLVGLLQASQTLSSERSVDRLRTRVTDTLSEITGATGVQVLMWDNETEDWVRPADPQRGTTVTVDEAAAARLLPLSAFRYAERTREPLIVADATQDHRFSSDPYFHGLKRCSLLIVPVMTHSEPRAMLVLENNLTRGAFSTDRLDAVNLIAGQLSVSLDNALIYASLERKVSKRTQELEVANRRLEVLAVTDALTGLANRRRLLDVLEVELLRSLRTGAGTGVMMIDIDFFKPYNDRYGHVAGDDCLRKVADALQRSIRATDVIARYGGEEFAVVLPRTGITEGKDIAERARAAVAALREPHLGAPGGTVTVSIGVASQTATRHTTTEQVLAAADAQLYEAKGLGRNRIQGLPS